MAERLVTIGRVGGPAAALTIVALVGAAFAGVLWRSGGALALEPSDLAALRFTVTQAFVSAALSIALAIPVARALARRRFVGRGLLITLLGAPFILPVIVAVLGLIAVFGRSGWINLALGSLGIAPISIYGFWGVVLAHVFFNLPLATRLILQGWQSQPAETFRLAALLGLPPGTIFRAIEWPILRQVGPGAFALIFAICLTSFAVALTLGGGPRATTLELAIYEAFRFDFDLARAAGLSLVQLLIAGAAAALALCLIPSIPVLSERGRLLERHDAPVGLRWWGDMLAITFAAMFLLLPIAALVAKGAGALLELPPSVWSAAWTSVRIALLSTLIMLSLAVPLAGWIASIRFGGIEAIGLLGLAVSPLTIGTGWFVLLHVVTNPAALTLPVTALVNALMTLPFALRALVPALRQGHAGQGRLAAALGLRGWRYWVFIALPLARAPLGFAAGLCAALSVGDLGVVALFASPEQATLPLQMARLMGAYRMETAAGAALLLLGLAFGVFWICDKLGRGRVTA